MMKKVISILAIPFVLTVFPLSLSAQTTGDVPKPVDSAAIESDPVFQAASKEAEIAIKTCEPKTETSERLQCIKSGMQKLSDEGNFVAQRLISIIHLSEKNKSESLKWNQTAIDNPKTPLKYKELLQEDRVEIEKN